jgi:hypothetical protein
MTPASNALLQSILNALGYADASMVRSAVIKLIPGEPTVMRLEIYADNRIHTSFEDFELKKRESNDAYYISHDTRY